MKNKTNSAALTELYEKTGAAGVNPDELSPDARAFLETPQGRREARMARSIAAGTAELPRVSVPLRLREMVFDRLFRPAYRRLVSGPGLPLGGAVAAVLSLPGAERGRASELVAGDLRIVRYAEPHADLPAGILHLAKPSQGHRGFREVSRRHHRRTRPPAGPLPPRGLRFSPPRYRARRAEVSRVRIACICSVMESLPVLPSVSSVPRW